MGDKARALPFFYAFSGSDATSQFSGKNKKTAWKTWKYYLTATEGFDITCLNAFVPLEVTYAAFEMIGFTCTMYDTTTSHVKVNDLRQEMFPTRVKMMEQLPPTQNALLQHTIDACFKSVFGEKV